MGVSFYEHKGNYVMWKPRIMRLSRLTWLSRPILETHCSSQQSLVPKIKLFYHVLLSLCFSHRDLEIELLFLYFWLYFLILPSSAM